MTTLPTSLSNLNLTTFNKIYPLLVQKYSTLVPDPNANTLDKINSMIDSLNSVGKLSNDVVDNWNKVMAWVMNDGLTTDVSNKLDAMVTAGTFDTIFQKDIAPSLGDITQLQTTDKSNLTNALNEVDQLAKSNQTNVGTLSNLQTTHKTDLVSAVNDNVASLADIALNPLQKGAKGDGVTDDTQAIQNTLNLLPNGGTLLLPYGYTFMTTGVTAKPNTRIIGYGAVLKGLSGTGDVLTLAVGCKVIGLEVDGNKTVKTGGKGIYAPTNVTDYKIEDCHIHDCVSQGILMDVGANGGKVLFNKIHDCQHGVQWWGGDSSTSSTPGIFDILIEGNIVYNVTGGIWGSLGERITVSNNPKVYNCSDVGIDFEGTKNSDCIGNNVKNCNNGGISFFYGSNLIEVTGNTVHQDNGYGPGIWFTTGTVSEDLNIHGNTIHTIYSIGIKSDQGSLTDSLIENNKIISDSVGECIYLLECDNVDVIGNKGRVAGGTAINVQGGSNCEVSENKFRTTSDTTSAGSAGGINLYWRSSSKPCQNNNVRNNYLTGFVTSINDDCWGDNLSHNWIDGNRVDTIYHKGTTGYYGKISNNVSTGDPNTAITGTSY